MPGVYVRADIQGIDKLLAKLSKSAQVYAEPWRRALTTLTEETEQAERQAAPHNRGELEARMTHRLDARAVPEWGIVSNDAASKRGYRYGFALNASDRYHYRSGVRAGEPTKGWFTKAFQRMRQRVEKLLGEAAKEIESRWQT